MKKIRHIAGTVILLVGLAGCLWVSSEPEHPVSMAQLAVETVAALATCFIGVLMLADVEFELPEDEAEKEKSR